MEELRTWMAIFGGIAVGQSLFLSLFLMLREPGSNKAPFFLGLLLIGLSLRIGKSLFYYLFPHYSDFGLVLGGTGLFMIGPALCLFMLSSRAKPLAWYQYLHFIPPLFLLGTGMFIGSRWVVFTYYIGTHVLLVYLMGTYWQARKLVWASNPSTFTWVFITVGTVWGILEYQLLSSSMIGYIVGSAFYCMLLYAFSFYLMRQQNIFKFTVRKSGLPAPELSPDLIDSVRELFAKEKIYRKKGLTLAQVAQELNRPVYQISQVIKLHHGLRFTEFVNKHRVEEAKSHLKDPGNRLKIEALATEVGFSSTSSLYQAFKRETQMTPQHYRKKHLRPVQEK